MTEAGRASLGSAAWFWFVLLGLAATHEAETDQPRTEQGEACRLRHGRRLEGLGEVPAAAVDVDRSKAAGARHRGHTCGGAKVADLENEGGRRRIHKECAAGRGW